MNKEPFEQIQEWMDKAVPFDFSFHTANGSMMIFMNEKGYANYHIRLSDKEQVIYVESDIDGQFVMNLDISDWDQSFIEDDEYARFLFGKGSDTYVEFYFYKEREHE